MRREEIAILQTRVATLVKPKYPRDNATNSRDQLRVSRAPVAGSAAEINEDPAAV